MERRLTGEEASSAAGIQRAIDAAALCGGRVVLPEGEVTLDRGLALRSGVELVGQGEGTVLRKGPGRVYPLSGYHNYGMCDVPLRSAAGLEPGMTVCVHDNRTHGGFYETFATITWVDGDWVGLDHGIEADYAAAEAPCLTTAHPLIFGLRVRHAAVRDLSLEGSRAANEKAMGGCRGGAVYFANSRDLAITGIRERDYFGEGLSFQMCRDVLISDCSFSGNTGNGLHPGAGSTNALFERCRGEGNRHSGFFFCVRANHITVRECSFRGNQTGVSIGTRDCHNVVERCDVAGNRGAGILVRQTPRPVEVHSCRIQECRLEGNATLEGQGQVEIAGEAHDLTVTDNEICGGPDRPGIFVAASARGVYLARNRVLGCRVEVAAEPVVLADRPPDLEAGYGTWREAAFRHLATA
ncbi:MAG: right-handed parallel beta-helix repeat-containing protein [Candidatus Latescibacterota bacterium]